MRTFLLGVGSSLLFACAGDNFAPTPAGSAGSAQGGASSGVGGSSSGAGGSSGGSGATAGGSAGANAGSAGANAGSAGANAGSAGADAGSGGADAGSGGSDAGAGGAAAGSGGANAGSGGANAGSGGASGEGGTGGTNGGAGGSNGGAAGNAGGGAGGSAGSSGASGGAGGAGPVGCSTLFVAPAPLGFDAPDRGCLGAPLATVGAALDRARSLAASKSVVTEIQICAGQYPETAPLVLDLPVSLRGGYGCAGGVFTPPASGALSSRIVPKKLPGLRISGGAVAAGTVVQNLYFDAAAKIVTERNAAIVVEAEASVTLRDFKAVAGTGSDSAVGSAAVVVQSKGSVTIDNGTLLGGEGEVSVTSGQPPDASAAGSAGLFVARDAGPVTVTLSIIEGGRGSSGGLATGSAGIAMRGPSLVVTSSKISGGEGRAVGSSTNDPSARLVRSIGVDTGGRLFTDEPASITISRSTVRGGNANGQEISRTVGIRVDRANAKLDHLRVYGGDANKPTDGDAIGATGALVGLESEITLSNSILHGGGALPGPDAGTGFTRAAYLEASKLHAHFVTFLAGMGGRTSAAGKAVGNAVALQLSGIKSFVDLHNSLLVAQTTKAFGVYGESACTAVGGNGKQIANTPFLDHVVFVQPESASEGHLYESDAGCGSTDSVAGLGPQGFQAEAVKQIVGSAGSSGTEPEGVVVVSGCGTNASCPSAVFDGYVLGGPGLDPTLEGVGLAPRCEVAAIASGTTQANGYVDDLLGVSRRTTTALGAVETLCP